MYKLFILLFIIFIINYFLLGFKEHYIDNIVLCDSYLKIFKNNEVLKEIQKGCPTTAAATTATAAATTATTATTISTTECLHNYDETIGLDKLLNNNNGNNTYTFTFTYINPEAVQGSVQGSGSVSEQLTMNGNWGYTRFLKMAGIRYTWEENVVKHIYADENDYPIFIDKTELSGYSMMIDTSCVVIFKSCNTLFMLNTNPEKDNSPILKVHGIKIEDYIPTTAAATTPVPTTTISTTECPHNYDETIGLDKLLNNNGKNTYIFTYINPESVQESKQLTMNGKWGNTLFIDLDGTRFTLEKNVVKYIYADENDYPIFIDKTELSGYSYVNDTYFVVIFKSCDTLLMLVNTPEKEIIKFHVTKIEDYIPTKPAGTTK